MRITICGGGVIGACCAYYLSRSGAEVVVVERTGIGCAASGKSGGFLALDWNDHSPLSELARRSFRLHEKLVGDNNCDWGYRRVETLSVAASLDRDLSDYSRGSLPDWISPRAASQGVMGTVDTTAQVHPALFTAGMMELARAAGSTEVTGAVDAVQFTSDQSRVIGISADGIPIDSDAVIVAMGPWSAQVSRWLPLPRVSGLKGNSVVLRPCISISPHTLFTDVEMGDGQVLSPEIYPRPDGTVYACGLSSEQPLTAHAAEVEPDAGAAARLKHAIAAVVPALSDAETVSEQACYRPVTDDGLPLIGKINGVEGAYLATGHSVWGILNAPATGEALAALVLEETLPVDLSPFDPGRTSLI